MAPSTVDGRRFRISLLVIVLSIVLAAAFIALFVATKPEVKTLDAPVRMPERVSTAVVHSGPFHREFSLLGTVTANMEARRAAQVAGNVVMISPDCEPGRRVRRGQVFARIDPADYQAAVDGLRASLAEARAALAELRIENEVEALRLTEAQAEFKTAESELRRKRELLTDEIISASEFDLESAEHAAVKNRMLSQTSRVRRSKALLNRSEAAVAARLADLTMAELDLQRTEIDAPFDGVIAERMTELGNRLKVDDPVFEIVNYDTAVVEIDAPSSRLNVLRKGMEVQVVDEDASIHRVGALKHISPKADAETRLFPAEVHVDNAGYDEGQAVLPGRFVTVLIREPEPIKAMALPFSAVTHDGGGDYVFIVEAVDVGEKAARKRYVDVYWRQSDAVLARGLNEGALLVTDGLENLADGTVVEIVDTPRADRELGQ